MGTLVANLLRRAKSATAKQLKELAELTGIPSSRLSEFQNSKKNAALEQLGPLADGYGIPFRTLVASWLLDAVPSQQERDRLQKEFFAAPKVDLDPFETLIESLGSSRGIRSAAKKIVDELRKTKTTIDSSTQEVLRALSKIRELNVIGGKSPQICIPEKTAWVPLVRDSRIEKSTIFVAKNPTPLVAELHRFPPRLGGLHREPEVPGTSPCYELWSVARGSGALLIERDGEWSDFHLEPGACGYYWSADRHVWINDSSKSSLVIFHAFFPYRPASLKVDDPGEAFEFSIDAPDERIDPTLNARIKSLARQCREN